MRVFGPVQTTVGMFLVFGMFAAGPLTAQRVPIHLNPVIERFAQGKAVIGVSTSNLSLESARGIARSDIDFVRLEMEHAPLDVAAARNFLVGMIDKAAILRKGNAQLSVAPFVRIAPYGRDKPDWIVKQMLDIGMMGIKFPTIGTKEEALQAIRSMRYPQLKGSPHMEPAGLRGMGHGNANWFWGIPGNEYEQRADLWPLNPQGDLLAIIMVESADGLKNVNEIAAVPGVGVIFAGVLGDMPRSLGVPVDSPEIAAAEQTILRACLTHNVICGAPARANNIERYVKEGWKYLDIGRAGGGLSAGSAATARAARALLE